MTQILPLFKRHSKEFTVLLLTLFVGGVIYFSLNSKSYDKNTDFKVPHFELKDIQGHSFQFPDPSFRGITLVHFWASWCEPCIDELPELLQFIESVQSQPVRLIAISLDSNWNDAKNLLNSLPKRPNLKAVVHLLDPELKSAQEFGSFQYPETIVLKDSDKILTKWVGPQKWNDPYYKKLLDYFLNLKPSP